jgi:hypothetical protein
MNAQQAKPTRTVVTAEKIREKLADLSPKEREQALEILKQIAQKQAQEAKKA